MTEAQDPERRQERSSDRSVPLPPGWEARAVEAAPDAVVTIDAAGRIAALNAAAERMFGYPRAEAIGRPAADLAIHISVAPPPGAASDRDPGDALDAPTALDRRVRLRARRRGGAEFPAELTVTRVVDAPPLFAAYVRDLSGTGSAEERESRLGRVFREAERLGHIGTWELDLRTRAITWSPEMYRIHGVAPRVFEPRVDRVLELVHPDDRARVGTLLGRLLDDPRPLGAEGFAIEYRALRDDGSVRLVRVEGRVDSDADGEPVRWIGPALDITDARLAERELQARDAVEQALRDWQTFEDGVTGLLRRLGGALESAVGALWIPVADGERLTCRALWSAPGVDVRELEPVTRTIELRPGEGLPGLAWQTGRPVLRAELIALPQLRGAVARAGLRSGLAFPALADDGPIAVLAYYTSDRRQPSDRLVRTLTGIGVELGRFLAPRRADLGMRRLSDREVEVLRLAAAGRSGPQIAEELVLSPATVKSHFENLYEKLGVSDRAAAVAYALRTGLIR